MSSLTLSHKEDKWHFVTIIVVLKQFQKNLFRMLRSLARISWDTGVPLGAKGCFSLSLGIF